MILIEKLIETSLRTAIRASLQSYGATIPALVDAKINCFWLGDEEGGPAEDASDLRVMLMAKPNSAEGYQPGAGLMPQRSISVDVFCVSQPDSDEDRVICNGLYEAVRSVFDVATPAFVMPEGMTFSALMITGGGSAEIEDVGQVVSFTVDMKISV
jgi:hypothetical protein